MPRRLKDAAHDDDGLEVGRRKITLRKDDRCVACAHSLPAQSQAWWDDADRSITCVTCGAAPAATPAMPDPSGHPSAWRPTSRHAAASGWAAAREARLSARLRNDLAGRAVVLDDRWVPPTKNAIDHLVIAPSGVWIIDAKHHTGKVVHRDVGSYLRTEARLFVDGRDRTALVTRLDAQVSAVRATLGAAGLHDVPVRPMLCFTNSEWGLLARPFTINGVLVTWTSKVAPRILGGAPTHTEPPMHLAAVLAAALPAAG
jgi:Nuclease-related domain